eukprot:GHVR01065648.1.p1 GENE.GHVR01065648.1~~GHVR01065648.1.p1  ORF type:complete len:147 (+),score=11.50 GHVR01065648.1:61-501(+)
MNKSQLLLEALEDLTWENYVEVSEALTSVNKLELDSELSRQATIYSYYQGLLSLAKQDVERKNLLLTNYASTTRKERKESSSTKQTAKDLDDFVESSDDYKELSINLIDAQFKYSLLKSLVSALEQKKDMIIQISSNRRAETNLYK